MEHKLQFKRTCFKIKYSSKREAKDAIVEINRKYKNRPDWKPLNDAYFCDECQCWHNTSLQKTASRNLTRLKNKQQKK